MAAMNKPTAASGASIATQSCRCGERRVHQRCIRFAAEVSIRPGSESMSWMGMRLSVDALLAEMLHRSVNISLYGIETHDLKFWKKYEKIHLARTSPKIEP